MTKASVPLFRNMLKAVTVETAATIGAQVGVNLLLPDGTVGTIAQLQNLFGSTASTGSTINTTDDVAEGQWNLYFTNKRAQDAVGAILANSTNVTLAYVGGTSITADLTNLTDSGAGTLLATTFDAKGRKTGSRAATLTTASTSRITIANPDASAGLPTFDLATVADAGGGTLQKTAFDAYGRKTGTSAATTSDLAEGSNLYFTAARVLATILAGLSTATSAAITAADSVLSAFGKLQAQITALAASLTGYVPTTRTISTTAPLTGGGDLSANRTFAIPAATTSVDGYLAHADWNTFNAKVPTTTTITAGTGLSGGGDLSANRTLALANTAVTPASYGDATHVATFTVDAQGRLTAAASVAISAGGSGTVTSVDVSGGTTGLTTSGGPITTSGTITLGGTLAVGNGGSGAATLTGILKGNGTSAFTAATSGTDYVIPSGNVATATAWATGRTITLTGNVTGVSSAWTGSANLSFATTIPASTVTLAMQANFAASSLMGNPTGSSAAPSAITLGTGLSFAGSVLSAATSPVSSVFGRTGAVVAASNDYTFAQLASKPTTLAGYGITDALATIIPAGYIDGMKMVWNSATSISVTSGTCYIQGSSAVISFPSLLTLSGLSLTASTWYHLYGYLNAGTPAIELVTTAPAAAYSGTARSKTGDTSRRYIGSIKTDASGNVYNFLHAPLSSTVLYQTSIYLSPFQVINGSASSATNVSCAGVVPLTGTTAQMAYANNDPTQTLLLGNSIAPPSASPIAWLGQVGKSLSSEGMLPLDGSQAFQYMFFAAPTSNFIARVKGYTYDR